MTNHTNVEEEEIEVLPVSFSSAQDAPEVTGVEVEQVDDFNVDIDDDGDDENEDPDHGVKGDEVQKYCDSETMAYVMGSIIHRLACEACSAKLAEVKAKDESEGFISLMTYERGHLHEPSNCLTSAVCQVMPAFLQHVLHSFHEYHVVGSCVEFLGNRITIAFCTDEYKSTALKFFARMIVRAVCREKNAAIKACKKRGPQSGAKLKRLNV